MTDKLRRDEAMRKAEWAINNANDVSFSNSTSLLISEQFLDLLRENGELRNEIQGMKKRLWGMRKKNREALNTCEKIDGEAK